MATINPFQAPINYAVDVQSPFEAAIGGFKIGQAGAEMQAQAQAREQAMKAQAELKTLFSNPNATADDFARVASMLPKDQAETVRKSFEMMSTSQQQNRLAQSGQIYAAMKSGQSDIAKSLLQEQADAFRNSGREQEAKAAETYLKLIDMNPNGSQATIGLMMASLPGGKEMLENIDKTLATQRAEEQAPIALTEAVAKADRAVADAKTAQANARNADEKAAADAALARANSEKANAEALVAKETTGAKISKERSEAEKAAVAAKFAESNAAIDLEKKGWDIRKLQSDMQIAKQNASIAAANNAIAREGNDLKRGELQLKLRELQDKRDQTVRERVSEANTSAMQADNLLNTVDGLMSKIVEGKDKKGNPIFSSSFRAAVGPLDVLTPTIQPDVSDIEETFETLGSQITMSRIGEMKGALSNKDLDTLRQSLQALSLRQSPEQLYKNLQEVQRLTLKARKGAFDKYGIPESRPDTPNVQPSAQEVNDILKKYGG